MPTSYSLNQQANRLYTDIHAVMAQIRAAESGTRLEREQFLALLAQKQSILAEASNIINQVSHTLDLACSDPSARVPTHSIWNSKTPAQWPERSRKRLVPLPLEALLFPMYHLPLQHPFSPNLIGSTSP